jgi:hypothetical protein
MLNPDIAITEEMIAAHGLTDDEYAHFKSLIGGREPTFTDWVSFQPCGTSTAPTKAPKSG